MKTTFLLMTASMLVSHLAFADNTCQNQVVQAVQAQVKLDYPGQNLTVAPPDMQGYDGGEEKSLDVKVVQSTGPSDLVATYWVTIDEVCSIEIQGREK